LIRRLPAGNGTRGSRFALPLLVPMWSTASAGLRRPHHGALLHAPISDPAPLHTKRSATNNPRTVPYRSKYPVRYSGRYRYRRAHWRRCIRRCSFRARTLDAHRGDGLRHLYDPGRNLDGTYLRSVLFRDLGGPAPEWRTFVQPSAYVVPTQSRVSSQGPFIGVTPFRANPLEDSHVREV